MDSGLNGAEVAEALGISKSYAGKILIGQTKYTTHRREPRKRALTEAEVQAIREDTRPQKEVAEEYGCVPSMVSAIKNYTYYGDVPGPDSKPTKKRGPNRKLTAEQIMEIRKPRDKKLPLKHWALTYDVSITTIFNAINKFHYEEVSG
ncbi:MAG: hypothetical protein ACK5LG_22195 [Bacteroides thetaiotaomicron]